MSDDAGRHVRRKRYRGSHPRAFSEKYKEHSPEEYREDVERVLSRGDTPAGSHRSILVAEVLDILAPRPGETAVDATLGHGGHALEILRAIQPGGRLFGLDLDPLELPKAARRIAAAGFPEGSFVPIRANFACLPAVLSEAGLRGADMLLADLGVSSMQIDDPDRGFSFKRKGPLDMRMDAGSGLSAREYLASVAEDALGEALRANADEAESAFIARAICLRRGRLVTTRDLAEAICSAFPAAKFKDPVMQRTLRRVFQAIRIEVNGEFRALEAFLASIPSCLKSGGRVAILDFHSGEDSRVEASFRAGLEGGLYSAISTEALRPSREERYRNPRSGSARLRWAIKASA